MEQHNKDRSRVSTVMEGLVRGIVEGHYGDVLPPQDVLSRAFGVSRTVMREALTMLLVRGMLDVRPKTGTRIRPVDEWRMIDGEVVSWRFRMKPDVRLERDVTELRRLIEPGAAALAAQRATAAEIAGIRAACEALGETSPAHEAHARAHALFHSRIVAASGNQLFRQMAEIIYAALTVTPFVVSAEAASALEAEWAEQTQTQRRVADAIERHEPEEAQAAVLALIGG
ncbi:FCD domain-containing protein [Paraburkholderia bonniea]|uniref:FadR/GntR family transcriptional regulator n=1 Tax=Paraburkholderia bonniea TaxID=2152891 RepID=UPI0012910C94|nr:FCD domain-containing protein [Paraburkholderia bonniea]WJF88918.1 FCD domain-containing protein [Paraburkholderia bonniea]WJF92234.1 FCD domain-containing protein [Paraburkholderia bonniea]